MVPHIHSYLYDWTHFKDSIGVHVQDSILSGVLGGATQAWQHWRLHKGEAHIIKGSLCRMPVILFVYSSFNAELLDAWLERRGESLFHMGGAIGINAKGQWWLPGVRQSHVWMSAQKTYRALPHPPAHTLQPLHFFPEDEEETWTLKG